MYPGRNQVYHGKVNSNYRGIHYAISAVVLSKFTMVCAQTTTVVVKCLPWFTIWRAHKQLYRCFPINALYFWSSWRHVRLLCGRFRRIWRHFRCFPIIVNHFRSLSGHFLSSWRHFRLINDRIRAIWRHLRCFPIITHHFRPLSGHFRSSWRHFRLICGRFRRIWRHFRRFPVIVHHFRSLSGSFPVSMSTTGSR